MRGVWAWGRQRDELGARPRPGSPHLSPSVLASALIFTADLCTNLRHVHGHGRARRHLVPILPVWFHSCTNPQAFMILIFFWPHSKVALVVKNKTKQNLPAHAGDVRDAGSIPGLGRSPGGGRSNPLQYSCLENPMDSRLQSMGLQSPTQLKQLSTHPNQGLNPHSGQ